jgi:putative heme-binding domain-containing protein
LGEYETALYGGDSRSGWGIFHWNSTAQCMRCHAIDGEGSNVGPDLGNIGNTLTREQILEAMVDPSARIAPGYGNVILELKDGQEVFGMLTKETAEELVQNTRLKNCEAGKPAFGDADNGSCAQEKGTAGFGGILGFLKEMKQVTSG